MRYWVVRDADTDRILGTGKHPSYIEFEDDLPPRLFTSTSGASAAMRSWKAGHWWTTKEWESTGEYGDGFYYQGLPRPCPVEGRAERNLEVIEVRLQIVENSR